MKYIKTIIRDGEFIAYGLGSALKIDIGKWVYRSASGDYYMENCDQLKRRLFKNIV